ncbi:M20/M25/M40 family metallo-hydrolase [Phenylobacterium immobile]|uniref:M20/M25/M40 family metallo-hydrolase n=1 Tax=Phenylobacterium immobile TaxID=21 RepID=UPI000AF30CD2|nr:M20/M25/M40 family metallo-hydrolase [Phenylobacterium immobile]
MADKRLGALALTAALAVAAPAAAQPAYPGQAAFRALYQELVEINTTLSAGSCTAASEAMAARLKAAGYPDVDVKIYVPADRPRDGNLVAILPGSNKAAKPILLLAHLDVVEAKREDWVRDPFKLVEEGGYFYARGAADDKAMAAAFTDALVRYRQEGFKPKRAIKLALTCGEETPDTFNGVEWLLREHPGVLDAEFALNEGAGGRIENGKRLFVGMQAGEKVYQNYQLEVTNPGGHSSRPVKDNAIYRLAAALTKIGAFDFPVAINEATKLYFDRMGALQGGPMGEAMRAVAAAPAAPPNAALQAVASDPSYNAMMRTTCVATLVSAGHADNALPQRAGANVNCRILPGESVDQILATLTGVIADPQVKVTPSGKLSPVSPPPALTARVLGPATAVAEEMYPGVPIIPAMSTGATDSRFLLPAGVPGYGLSGMGGEPDGGGVHGLNERIRVDTLYEGREFLYRVVKLYAR